MQEAVNLVICAQRHLMNNSLHFFLSHFPTFPDDFPDAFFVKNPTHAKMNKNKYKIMKICLAVLMLRLKIQTK